MPGYGTRARYFYAGLAALTGATLALEIIQTRILSVVSWYHLAFFVISVAMFGMTAGALAVFLRPAAFPESEVSERLARYSFYAALATALAYLDQIVLAPEMVLSASALIAFARLALTISVPFFFSGVVVTLALTRTPYPVGVTYGADLVGAAVGCVAVIPLLSWLDGPGAVFAAGAMMAVASALFAESAGTDDWRRRASILAVVLAVAALLNGVTRFGLDPIVVKGQAEKRHRIAYEKWNSFSRVVAYKPVTEPPSVFLWAASEKTPKDKVDVVTMNIDGLAGTAIYAMRGDPANVDFLRYDATAMAHALRRGKVAVIGVGGGKDVMAALAFGDTDVTGVELNPALTGALTGPYREFAGLADHPGVRLITGEARSHLTPRGNLRPHPGEPHRHVGRDRRGRVFAVGKRDLHGRGVGDFSLAPQGTRRVHRVALVRRRPPGRNRAPRVARRRGLASRRRAGCVSPHFPRRARPGRDHRRLAAAVRRGGRGGLGRFHERDEFQNAHRPGPRTGGGDLSKTARREVGIGSFSHRTQDAARPHSPDGSPPVFL
ncbi:MAG: hypothetical protein M5R36_09035 [Deltaproteobacteria bacterium]|nr:hypothetical protein [Deltaproteobacteria bacterium]